MITPRAGFDEIIKRGLLAGAAGGVAEIIWVSLFATLTGGDAATLARGVTTAAGVSALIPAAPVSVGIAVHMALALSLGIVLVSVWQLLARRGPISLYGFMLGALAAIWAVNFFVVLPAISPSFVNLMPYWVSLISKLLFGFAAAETLRRSALARETGFEAVLAAANKPLRSGGKAPLK
jgi:hypothetical protein